MKQYLINKNQLQTAVSRWQNTAYIIVKRTCPLCLKAKGTLKNNLLVNQLTSHSLIKGTLKRLKETNKSLRKKGNISIVLLVTYPLLIQEEIRVLSFFFIWASNYKYSITAHQKNHNQNQQNQTILATKCMPLSAIVTRHHCCHKVTLSTGKPVSAGQNCKSALCGSEQKFLSCKKPKAD